MNNERFAQLLASYGGRPGQWPQGERDAALAWLAGNAEAARQQREARELDDLLDAHELPGPDANLTRRVNLGFQPRVRRSPLREWWFGLALGSAAAAGVAFGALVPQAPPQGDAEALAWADLQATAFGSNEWGEWLP